eukprot:Gregarina_sp_Pseudo_9__5481@NODE_6_length_7085_cov_13_985524_g4_i0_p1_GENE_NODE_6_length_7085_cov_13_985524_g4_i0NODE_6_length_7085_cov_13_985524_g4_i0_p1_ORF_typecomplete_len1005_score226_25Acyl_transf_3/PF01757_22/1e03Acyl_transf_3/PF01757_22/2_7e34DUF4491/PF14898_6/3_7e02DUF4491/PF14898_6/2_6_NODE_6_length_7085_cov_13_985524_g4_i011864200
MHATIIVTAAPTDDDLCKHAVLDWVATRTSAVSLLQPTHLDVDDCYAGQHTQFCFLKRRLPLTLPSSDLPAAGGDAVSRLWASLSLGLCLPVSCGVDQVAAVFDSMCAVAACTQLDTPAETQLCTLTQALHCDARARLHAPVSQNLFLHCASPSPAAVSPSPAAVSPSPASVALAPTDLRALVNCGSAFIRDWKLIFQSGTLQDLGDFDGCSAGVSNYCLIEYYDILASGRCVPTACSQTEMWDFFHFVCAGIGTDGMAPGVESTCLDYVNVVPLDLCVTIKLLGCGFPFRMADAASGVMDIKKIIAALFHPEDGNATDTVPGASYFGSVLSDLSQTLTRISDGLASIVADPFTPQQLRHLMNQPPANSSGEVVSYTVSCDLQPVSKENRDWFISLWLLGSFFLVLPLLGLLTNRTSLLALEDDPLSSMPTPIANNADTDAHSRYFPPSQTFVQRVSYFVGSHHRLNRFLACFCLSSNIDKATQQRHHIRRGRFPHLDGLRALSICWIVVGHSFIFGMRPGVLHNLGSLSRVWDSFTFQVVYSAQFAVDTFFLISGLMLGTFGPDKVLRLLRFSRSGSPDRRPPIATLISTWAKMVMQRFLRIVGLYYFVMALSYYTLQYAGFSPRWPSLLRLLRTGVEGGCQKYWWSLALLINNLYPPEAMTECFGHAWFLANDFQFFMIGAALIIVACLNERWFHWTWWTLMAASLAMTWHTIIVYDIRLPASYLSGMEPTIVSNHKSMATGVLASLTKFYSKPWCRIPPYLLGLYYGRLFTSGAIARSIGLTGSPQFTEPTTVPPRSNIPPSQNGSEQYLQLASPSNQRTAMSMFTRQPAEEGGDVVLTSITNLAVVGLMLFLIFIPFEANKSDAPEWNRLFDASYMAFSRTAWALALGWMICCVSYTRPRTDKKSDAAAALLRDPLLRLVSDFLCQPLFANIAQVSYALYLIHLPIQEVYYASLRQSISLTEGVGWFHGMCFAGVSIAAAAGLYLFVEVPIANVAGLIGI